MKAGLGLIEVKIKAEEDIRREAWDEGFEHAADRAYEVFGVPYPCSRCGMEMVVDTDEQKKVIKEFMLEKGWGHSECPNR